MIVEGANTDDDDIANTDDDDIGMRRSSCSEATTNDTQQDWPGWCLDTCEIVIVVVLFLLCHNKQELAKSLTRARAQCNSACAGVRVLHGNQ